MKLLYIYGPPAAGKLTIAKEVAALTGYRLFHNHLSIDAVLPVFEFGTVPFWRTVHAIRELVLAEAASEGVDIIYTSVYDHLKDLPLVLRRFDSIEQRGGSVCLVQLVCDPIELEGRIGNADRAAIGKLTSLEGLRAIFEESEVFTPIPGRESLSIDTTRLAPDGAARQIVAHYGLSGQVTSNQ